MKVLVCGGAGFLGSYLVEAMAAENYDVTVYDLKPFIWNDLKVRTIIGDIADEKCLAQALRQVDVVFNLVALSDIDACIQNPVQAVRLNVLGNAILLNQCVKARVKRFVLASTLYVNSSSGGFYRSTKQASELIVEDYAKYHNLKYTILRYGTPYGPGANPENSVHRFLKQALEERKIEYYGTGDEVREFIHAHDAAILSIKALKPEYENDRVIITGLHPIKIQDFFIMINEILGSQITLHYQAKTNRISDAHYQVTPYSYNPKIAKKIINDSYLDLGQGILDCIKAMKHADSQVFS